MIEITDEGCLLLVDKPLHWTSFDVVKKLKYLFRPRKIGHAGTLDPLASGLLLIGINRFTKKLNELQSLDKSYTGTLEIGKTTPSFDLETDFNSNTDISSIDPGRIEETRKQFIGELQQYPPAHSAVKVNGQRAYKKARRNEDVELKPRQITIHNFQLIETRLPEIDFEVTCSKGTYIRSLAHDFGQKLGVGAYLKKLRRTSVGEYKVEDSYTLEDLVSAYQGQNGGN